MARDLVFETGTEELPASYISDANRQLKEKAAEKFCACKLSYDKIEVYATPRRLILYVRKLDEKQDDYVVTTKGPSKKVAFDESGNPTRALTGFLKGQKATLEDIKIKELKGTDYVYVNKQVLGKPTSDLLKDILPDIVKSLGFPKSMRWGDHDTRFARPIRWLLALYGDETISFNIENITSSNYTYGHRFLSNGKLKIMNTDMFFKTLKDAYVIYDQNERRQIILNGAKKLAQSVGGTLVYDEELLSEITYLVEYPTPLMGTFDEEFLSLPDEVVITPMKEHQRYFPVIDNKGKLLHYFITVRNGGNDYIDEVRKGNERVLRARLKDADFFYKEDKRFPLEHYVDKLKKVVFQADLGTLYDKTQRIMSICEFICDHLDLGKNEIDIVKRAAYLCKADLVTQMVDEFDELQGVMGMYYAVESGEKEEVAKAIGEQYKPAFAGDMLPESPAGKILSIADKIDTVAGCFSKGLEPTGSQDPYGLRRSVIGVINIMCSETCINIDKVLDKALDNFMGESEEKEEVKLKLIDFIKQRFKGILMDEGIRYDVADAVLGGELKYLPDIRNRADALMKWLDNNEISMVLTTFKRVSNLAKFAGCDVIKPELFTDDEEKDMYDCYKKVKESVDSEIDNGDYDKALVTIKELYQPLNTFFDKVMVMSKDNDLKNNRLALLLSVQNMMMRIANFSLISY